VQIKINRRFLRLALSTIRARKRAWLFTVAASIIIPFIDIAVTGSVYLIFTEEKRAGLFSRIYEYGRVVDLPSSDSALTQQSIVFIVGVVLVLLSLLLKYKHKLIVGELREFFAVGDSQQLITGYLATSTQQARLVSKERITSSILHDCGSREQYCRILISLGAAGVGLLLYGMGAIALSWQIVSVVCVIYILPFVITRKIYALVEKLSQKQIKLREKVIHRVREVGDSIERVRADGLETHIGSYTLETVVRQKRKNLDMVRAKAKFATVFDGFGQLQLLIVVFASSAMLGQPVGTLLVLIIVFAKLQGFFGKITGGLQSINIASTKVERYESLMSLVGTPELDSSVAETAGVLDRIELRDVSFSYQSSKPILENFSLEVKSGDRVLLSGQSGIGKSTLLEILGGLLKPNFGTVLFNNEGCTNQVFRKYRHQICFVTPHVYIFDNTIRYNLSPGREIEEDKLWSALSNVELDDFVNSQSMLLDTKVGPNGSLLSTGQRQRLVLARAFLQQPTIFILDEFTANLDKNTEDRIMHMINQLAGESTITIMAAHKVPVDFHPTIHLKL
jgi:ABC-type bacteriocin/lantibiotic exporter with double-glycine peptidase domain